MVTEQIANLSAGNRRPGSNPGLSADVKSQCESAGFFAAAWKACGTWVNSEFDNTSSENVEVIRTLFYARLNHRL